MKPYNKHHANKSFPVELLLSIYFTLAIICFAAAMALFSPAASADELEDELKWLCAESTKPCPRK